MYVCNWSLQKWQCTLVNFWRTVDYERIWNENTHLTASDLTCINLHFRTSLRTDWVQRILVFNLINSSFNQSLINCVGLRHMKTTFSFESRPGSKACVCIQRDLVTIYYAWLASFRLKLRGFASHEDHVLFITDIYLFITDSLYTLQANNEMK